MKTVIIALPISVFLFLAVVCLWATVGGAEYVLRKAKSTRALRQLQSHGRRCILLSFVFHMMGVFGKHPAFWFSSGMVLLVGILALLISNPSFPNSNRSAKFLLLAAAILASVEGIVSWLALYPVVL